MNEKTNLEPTAALVIDLARKFYLEDELTSRYLSYLDISSGQAMIDGYKDAAIYDLAQELIAHRKFIIRHVVLEGVRAHAGNSQVVILAAGKAPLALELLSREHDRIEKIYEVDVSPLDQKRKIYQELAPELSNKIVFFQGDIRSSELLKNLEQVGFNPALRTVIVLEGITHYMTPEELERTLALFTSADHCNHLVVIDFGPPYNTLTARRQPIAREAYRIIEDNCFKKPMTKHTADGMATVFRNIGGNLLHHYTIHDIEKLRFGHNEFFPEKNSGWLEYIVARI